jgi:hypothetical protein
MRIVFFLSFLSLLVLSCNNSGKKKDVINDSTLTADSLQIKANQDSINAVRDSALLVLTKDVLNAFKNKKYDSLSLLVHPEEGVRFSPYGYADTSGDKVIKAETIKVWMDKKKQVKIFWGYFDANDEEIKMTMDQYVKRFVYDVNFIKPDTIAINGFIAGGNTLNNLMALYPGCFFVESHFKGFDKKQDGMDWRSLRLVFKMKDGKYYLVAVIHDEWTI